jgi:hypothetical protein
VPFAGWSTYTWSESIEPEDPDPRTDNSLLRGRIEHSVDAGLEQRGYTRVAADDSPDFRIRYYVLFDRRLQVEVVDQHYGWSRRYMHQVASHTYISDWDESDLIIDFLDPNSERLYWRGSGVSDVFDEGDPEEREALVEQVVEAILEHFPPSSSR